MVWNIEELKQFGAKKGMEWKFITPRAPHQNGCAEALVKSCKTALKRAVGAQVLTPFELYTVLLEVANLVNQRPIGRIPNDPDDGSYLSPNDMLLGRASTDVPQGKWCVRRVLEVFPGLDGKVRNVKVKTESGEYQRPITKISVIYPAEGYDDED